ncbi:hypothetical protein ACSBR2_005252 [Camellia fascicularis]
MARRTACVVGGVPLLRKPRVLRSSAAGRDCSGAREEWPLVLVVPTAAATRRRTTVLGHAAVGGFALHCGWNLILESLWFGVPIVTWPIYAEQQINVFEMVKDLDLAVELRLDCRDECGDGSYGCGGAEVVAAEEIERAMRGVMDGGNLVREKVREIREKSREAVMEGGSSFSSLKRLVDDVVGND